MVEGGIGGKFRVVALKGVGTGGGPIGLAPGSLGLTGLIRRRVPLVEAGDWDDPCAPSVSTGSTATANEMINRCYSTVSNKKVIS